MKYLILFLLSVSTSGQAEESDVLVIESELVHLRSSEPREWATFPADAQANRLERRFDSATNSTPWTLSLRQHDVKQTWKVNLNGQMIGRLVADENDLRTDFEISPGRLVDGRNQLEIFPTDREASDDIRVGAIQLHPVAPKILRSAATVEVSLTSESGVPLPGRITITDEAGTLIPVGATSGHGLAVREGVIYTSKGSATFGVAAGDWRIFGGRGFEYATAQADVHAIPGDRISRTLKLKREVDTTGWVACDTHVHTLTHSGHGDCTIEERMVTLAGEGIELPIATDHNKQIDYSASAKSTGVASHFTSVIGNEVTTQQGHFNIFPVREGSPVPDHTRNDWRLLFESIFTTPGVRVAILNHAQDVHSGFRPFSSRRHIRLTGENLDDRAYGFNAMEVLNSGAIQTDPMILFSDWCGLINRGLSVTPVGSSDSHDVSRFIVGQGRTYIECDDADVAAIPVEKAVDAFLQGRVVVSYGLFTRLSVTPSAGGKSYGPGDLVTVSGKPDGFTATVEVHGPEWTQAETIALYVCGGRRFEATLKPSSAPGTSLKGTAKWQIPRTEWSHDIWLTTLATGPGIDAAYWPTAKPYQPDSPEFAPYVLSLTGPIRIDMDGDGKYSSPRDYAQQIITASNQDLSRVMDRLQKFDASVIHQAASLLEAASVNQNDVKNAASDNVLKEIQEFRSARRTSDTARLDQTE
ncbi:MAG: CehA/McbA family metallohydrolase [Planctomycetaceae bacterium]